MRITSTKHFVWPGFTIAKGESQVASIPEEVRTHVAHLVEKKIVTLHDEEPPAPDDDGEATIEPPSPAHDEPSLPGWEASRRGRRR